jgi:hypothetical protein
LCFPRPRGRHPGCPASRSPDSPDDVGTLGGARATPRVELIAGHRGSARVAAYTVTYEQAEPTKCTIIADTPSGTRCMASCDDAAVARRAPREELVGTTVGVDGIRFEL